MATNNTLDMTSLINAVLSSITQQHQRNNTPQTNNEQIDISNIFGPSPPVPAPIPPQRNNNSVDSALRSRRSQPYCSVTPRDRKLLMSLGFYLLTLEKRGELSTNIVENLNGAFSNIEEFPYKLFRDNALGNVETVLGEEDGTLDMFDNLVDN